MKVQNEIKLAFPSRSANEAFARTALSAFITPLDPTIEELTDIKTAVSEAVTNAIVHAYPNTLGKITLRLRLLEDRTLEIQVKDKGVGIPDIAMARTPMFTTGSDERAGMGFTIMESFMDTLKVHSAPGRGTRVTMRRKIARRGGV